MDIGDLWDGYKDYTSLISGAARQLSFAGFAVVWIYNDSKGATFHMPHMLLWATIAFIIAILLDYLQYAYGTAVYYIAARYREHKGQKSSKPLGNRVWLPGELCLIGKSIAVVVGYAFLLTHVASL